MVKHTFPKKKKIESFFNFYYFEEQFLTPEKFGEMLCEDLDLSTHRFVQPIADSIRAQVLDFESFTQVQLPATYTRVVINVNTKKQKVKNSL